MGTLIHLVVAGVFGVVAVAVATRGLTRYERRHPIRRD
ncbi:hypothetical protein PROPHIT493_52 [Mycobacterium phage prophiT49-3]|nr:hypothetical protein PROPHIT493_52 [Mycobacterium phage prophiT49-3]